MLRKSPEQKQPQTDLFKPLLSSFINMDEPLVKLSHELDWSILESAFADLYSHTGAPAKPVRRMAGLLMLKQVFNLSDERVVEVWQQNPYYQYFTGETHFQWQKPCDPSDLVHFRKRIGEDGARRIHQMSVGLFREELAKAKHVNVDTTVQEKNVTFPTDLKLAVKIIAQLNQIARSEGIEQRQRYTRVVKECRVRARFAHHPKRKKQARKAIRKVRTIAGRLLRELDRKLSPEQRERYVEKFELFERVLGQKRHDKEKIYSLHEPEVACIAKGKAHKPYEFGAKIGVATLPGSNIVVGVERFSGNPHDSQTLAATLARAEETSGRSFEEAVVDRGYRGAAHVGQTRVVLPSEQRDRKLSRRRRERKRKQCRGRAAIEPVIGHMKHDCRMERNYLKGAEGDVINAVLAGAAFNFRKFLAKAARFCRLFLAVLESSGQFVFTSFVSKQTNCRFCLCVSL